MKIKDKKNEKVRKGKTAEASLTIEAALSFTLFLFAVVCLIMPMKMLDTQRRVQMILESVSKQMSQYAYLVYQSQKGEELLEGERNEDDDNSQEAWSFYTEELFSREVLQAYLQRKICNEVGKQRIKELDFTGTNITLDGESINLQVRYSFHLPFAVFRLKSINGFSRSFRRGWIGSDGGSRFREKTEKERKVYVGNRMSCYHSFPNCHYISNQIEELLYQQVLSYKNNSGMHYKPCKVCGKEISQSKPVYVMPNGVHYHSRQDCSSIRYYVRTVRLEDVKELGECQYCKRKREGR